MALNGLKIGLVVTGSFCTLDELTPQITKLVQAGAEIYPILSYSISSMDTRFGTAEEWRSTWETLTGQECITTIPEAEPIGPKKLFDVVVVAPCTGNTMAKLANGITDTPALMAVKAHLRNQRPVVLSISTNDGLGMNAKNLGLLLNAKNIFIVPFGQDNPQEKTNSLVSYLELLPATIEAAMDNKQLQPLLLSPREVWLHIKSEPSA
ncbi:MAG: dipicolinate synthase subunit B [Firmicutes bacterium]|nr:dipicolinate synthase subunit B [Bacillota bacterium]